MKELLLLELSPPYTLKSLSLTDSRLVRWLLKLLPYMPALNEPVSGFIPGPTGPFRWEEKEKRKVELYVSWSWSEELRKGAYHLLCSPLLKCGWIISLCLSWLMLPAKFQSPGPVGALCLFMGAPCPWPGPGPCPGPLSRGSLSLRSSL